MNLAMARVPDRRELTHENLGEHRFEAALSNYDTKRRVETLVEDFLRDVDLTGLRALDVGCGLGYFSEALQRRGAIVTACDLGSSLVETTRRRVGCEAFVADALALDQQFAPRSFDVVLSSECIEHTPDPLLAMRQMARLVCVGGWLSLSTPNVVWKPVVAVASRTRVRPFDGFENFSTWRNLRRVLNEEGLDVVRERGLHLLPFQLPIKPLLRACDRLQLLRAWMINLCILGRRVAP